MGFECLLTATKASYVHQLSRLANDGGGDDGDDDFDDDNDYDESYSHSLKWRNLQLLLMMIKSVQT